MNPHMRPSGFPGQGQPHMMMSQGPMMNPQMNPQMHMMQRPVTNNPMGGVRMGAPPMGAVRMGAPPPPSYNQALAHSNQNVHRAPVNQRVRATGRPSEKEKYFLQQQAKLKQFGKGSGAGSSMDPTKLIDTMFGSETPKPRTKPHEQPPVKPVNTDDGFGDFLGSGSNNFALNMIPGNSNAPAFVPGSSGVPVQGSSGVQVQGSSGVPVQGSSSIPPLNTAPTMVTASTTGVPVPASPTSPTSKIQAKDLSEMMLESCDLKAASKSHGFQKPTLKDINPGDIPHAGPHQHHMSQKARAWQPSEELTELFSTEEIKVIQQKTIVKKGKGPVKARHPPTWLTDVNLQHPVYRQVLEASLVDNEISTERLYPILLLSGLQKEMLGGLWGMCNKFTPGKLTAPELTQLLALIALTQNNIKVETVDILRQVPQCPVPILASPAMQSAGPAIIHQQSTGSEVIQPAGTQPGHGFQPPPHSGVVPATGNQVIGAQPGPGFASPPQNGIAPVTGSQNVSPPQMMGTGPGPVPMTGAVDFAGPAMGSLAGTNSIVGPVPISNTYPTSQAPLPGAFMGQAPLISSSAPATLPVTQLPSGGVAQTGSVVDDDDDFADFQAAAPTTTQVPSLASNIQPPKSSFQGRVVRVPQVSDKVMAASLSPEQLKSSTVENFFGSDDSSETASPDDEYFDGYKSADSKPSDSTSQFSTDQSDGDDFKNFDNYLDEFQRKREQQDKESPLHRPISKLKGTSPQSSFAATVTPPKIALVPMPSHAKQSGHQKVGQLTGPPVSMTSVFQPAKAESADEFSDFADFQTAPVAPPVGLSAATSASAPVLSTAPTKSAAPIKDLIGDEDKYAALRTLDFSTVDVAPTTPPASNQKAAADDDDTDDWADFEHSTVSQGDQQTGAVVMSEVMSEVSGSGADASGVSFLAGGQQGSWEGVQAVSNDDGDWADFQDSSASFTTSNQSTSDISQSASFSNSDVSQGISFTAFGVAAQNDTSSTQNSGLVNVKKDTLNQSEIMGLFKVKSEPITNIKSKDDDFSAGQGVHNITMSESINRSHGIRQGSSSPDSLNLQVTPSVTNPSDDDDHFMVPPPMDDFGDDEHDEYSRGYDFDDMMKPHSQERKKVYGVYGANESFVVEGHKKKSGTLKSKLSDPHLNIDSDNDSDSTSLKDYDMFKGKLSVNKAVEDSQSIASLEFVSNKNLQVAKDDGDSQSQSSAEFNNFEVGSGGDSILPESKSLDSLDLRQDDVNINESIENVPQVTGQSKQTSKAEMLNDSAMPGGLPILGDRYSAILPPELSSSDKPTVEWQRCLDSCYKIIQQANNIFNSISSSDVCNEVMRTPQGSQYIEGVIEIYRVVSKITQAMTNTGIQSEKLSKCLKDIDLAWNNLTAFLVGASVMPEPSSIDFTTSVTSEMVPCGLCLLSVDLDNDNQSGKLAYAGNQYHASCANFWINCVDSCLPALTIPQLL